MIPLAKDPVATLVFFLIVFVIVGAFFLFIHLVIGSFIRPYVPDKEKLTIYECGEPTVGSAWIQFDLRYYVVALLFVIFDVEVAFFFPWATVFGKANQLANLDYEPITKLVAEQQRLTSIKPISELSKENKARYEEIAKQLAQMPQTILSRELLPAGLSKDTKTKLGLAHYELANDDKGKSIERLIVSPIKPEVAVGWAKIAFLDILVFFGVLMVGFAYVWRRGDINWVRSFAQHVEPPMEAEKPLEQKAVASPPPPPVVAVHH